MVYWYNKSKQQKKTRDGDGFLIAIFHDEGGSVSGGQNKFCQQLSPVVISVLSKHARKIFNEVIDDRESDVSKIGIGIRRRLSTILSSSS